MILLIYLGIIVALLLWGVGIYNGLVKLRNQVRTLWAQIEVQLKRRYDLIPNLVEVVKDYMGYEQETLSKVVEARGKAMSTQGIPEKAMAENQLSGALRSLFAVAESYPDLKANQNVSRLQEELANTENMIANMRSNYNQTVMDLNNRTETFPSNLIARWFAFQPEKFYTTPDEERAAPRADLR
ncbi:LemA family protein [candidate division KSB1 bacterium]|nr:LemA family protein [candidate division KSB1 bacterium]